MNRIGSDRRNFRGRLDNLLHPSMHIELADQLKGRSKTLGQMLDAFETPGAHPFIWGPRGIGKTSIGHTACIVHDDTVELRAAVACGRDTSFRSLLQDIFDAVSEKNPDSLRVRIHNQ